MESTYNPTQIEDHWHKQWEALGQFSPSGQGESFCIMIPPPNVTGSLHMGHGFENTLIDCVTRYQRAIGKNTLWQVGTDHAGIATQMVVERQLLAQQKTRHDLGREAFIDTIWDWKDESGGIITQQLRRLGASCDWSREKFTMDASLSSAVSTCFIKLYDDGLIYRGLKLVNWDPKLETAISDLEVINTESQGSLWHMRYPIVGSNEYVVVATTRPETLFGDMAVAVHPDDKRYQHLIGQHVVLPLCDREIPIIADDEVNADFGTGCVKITPAHDFNDYQMGQRHTLEMVNIMTPTAHLNTNVPTEFQGLSREAAREKVVSCLTEQDLIDAIEPHTLQLPIGDRSGVVIEPYLTQQWFVKCSPLAAPAIDAVKSGQIHFYPKNHENTYFHWLENIQDWCISRQLWWGHQIPAWYDDAGTVYVGENETHIREKYGLADNLTLSRDPDVLDTWFSSALWPFATLGWPDHTPDMQTFFPTQSLITGHDLIFYWVARMIMMSLYCTGKIPFEKVCIHGLIRDEHNEKMSKSKGNVIDPIDLIDGISLDNLITKRTHGLMQPALKNKIIQNTKKSFPQGITAHGTDALRFTYCALATTGRDIRFDMQRLEGYRNFCNKIWNGSRFVLQLVDQTMPQPALSDLSHADLWLYHRLEKVKSKTHDYYTDFRFDHLAKLLYDFVWTDFCSWGIEMAKAKMANQSSDSPPVMTHTLVTILQEILILLHPITPFITEAIWQELGKKVNLPHASIGLASYPKPRPEHAEFAHEEAMAWLMDCVHSIRSMRSEMQISPAKTIPVILHSQDHAIADLFRTHQDMIQALSKSSVSMQTAAPDEPCANQILGLMTVSIPLAGLIAKDEEITRVKKQLSKLAKSLDRGQRQLQNPRYLDNAPSTVVADLKQQVSQMQMDIEHYQQHLKELDKLA